MVALQLGFQRAEAGGSWSQCQLVFYWRNGLQMHILGRGGQKLSAAHCSNGMSTSHAALSRTRSPCLTYPHYRQYPDKLLQEADHCRTLCWGSTFNSFIMWVSSTLMPWSNYGGQRTSLDWVLSFYHKAPEMHLRLSGSVAPGLPGPHRLLCILYLWHPKLRKYLFKHSSNFGLRKILWWSTEQMFILKIKSNTGELKYKYF